MLMTTATKTATATATTTTTAAISKSFLLISCVHIFFWVVFFCVHWHCIPVNFHDIRSIHVLFVYLIYAECIFRVLKVQRDRKWWCMCMKECSKQIKHCEWTKIYLHTYVWCTWAYVRKDIFAEIQEKHWDESKNSNIPATRTCLFAYKRRNVLRVLCYLRFIFGVKQIIESRLLMWMAFRFIHLHGMHLCVYVRVWASLCMKTEELKSIYGIAL